MSEIINSFEPEPEVVPLLPDGTPKKKFEVKIIKGENDVFEKAIFIDGEWLDWSVDLTSLMDAKRMGLMFFKAAQKDIEKHFTESVSEVLGRRVSVDEIKQAIKTGWI